jgi:carbon-monoxide dehydrogenase small subunit
MVAREAAEVGGRSSNRWNTFSIKKRYYRSGSTPRMTRFSFPKQAPKMPKIELRINDQVIHADVDPRTLLVQLIREHLSLTGTHRGCDTSQCGACTVLIDGRAIKSCSILAAQVQGCEVLTVEGLAKPDGPLHPIQQAFSEHHGLQCGFCTPGMLMITADLLNRNPSPDDAEVREALEGNLCRCTGYQNIVKAVQHAAMRLRTDSAGRT